MPRLSERLRPCFLTVFNAPFPKTTVDFVLPPSLGVDEDPELDIDRRRAPPDLRTLVKVRLRKDEFVLIRGDGECTGVGRVGVDVGDEGKEALKLSLSRCKDGRGEPRERAWDPKENVDRTLTLAARRWPPLHFHLPPPSLSFALSLSVSSKIKEPLPFVLLSGSV